jgi:exodeoxyribonuclease VII small subunit
MTDSNAIEAQITALELLLTADDFEAVHAGLTESVRLLESAGIGLNHSIRAYEIGRRLSDRAQALLDAAELRISMLDADGSGSK